MRAERIDLNWHPGISIYASEPFLKLVGDEYGWIGGIDKSGNLRCILPFTVVRKMIYRMVRSRVETIPVGVDLPIEEEKRFLNSAMEYQKSSFRGYNGRIKSRTRHTFCVTMRSRA